MSGAVKPPGQNLVGGAPEVPGSAPFTAAGVRRGFLLGQPLAPGALLYGVVFGVLASQRGLAWLEAVLMSAFVYSSSAQLAVLQGWNGSVLLAPLAATILVMNARYVLYGAALQPWLAGVPRSRALGALFFLGDGNWALSMKHYHEGGRDAGFVLGSGVAMFMPWVLGTVLGYVLGHSIPNPAVLGLDFMLVAFAAAIGISTWRGKADLAPAAAAFVAAWLLHRYFSGAWYIVAGGLAAGAAGAWRHGR